MVNAIAEPEKFKAREIFIFQHLLFHPIEISCLAELSMKKKLLTSGPGIKWIRCFQSSKTKARPRGYKKFSMLNSDENEIYPAHKC